jgi:hypothetical protein
MYDYEAWNGEHGDFIHQVEIENGHHSSPSVVEKFGGPFQS